MFSQKKFQTWGKGDAILFAAVMTRIEGRENDRLLRKYGFSGFPSLAILDADGALITKQITRNTGSIQSAMRASQSYASLKKKVDADMLQASELGVTGTPAFFINGRFLSGAQPFENFKRTIDAQLDKKS